MLRMLTVLLAGLIGFGRFLLYFLFFILFLILINYSISPFYSFPAAVPFHGPKFHNPYAGLDTTLWLKGNFQVQSRVWGGITNGRKNDAESIYRVYQKVGYDVIGISDYMHVNTWASDSSMWLPMYEHGFGIRKNHQVCLGTEAVDWMDYPFPQHIHQKQHILNLLRPDNEVVAIAHPRLMDAYSPEDMSKLCGYDCIEVLNTFRESIVHWDSALSAGRIAYIMANDDAHDITKPHEVARYCTMVNSTGSGAEVVSAIKAGRAFGARLPNWEGMTFGDKTILALSMPRLLALEVRSDSLIVRLSAAAELRFIGQGGEELMRSDTNTMAVYILQPEDTYVRVEAGFADGTYFFLNPVFRYTGDAPEVLKADLRLLPTYALRILGGLVIAGLFYLLFFRRRST